MDRHVLPVAVEQRTPRVRLEDEAAEGIHVRGDRLGGISGAPNLRRPVAGRSAARAKMAARKPEVHEDRLGRLADAGDRAPRCTR